MQVNFGRATEGSFCVDIAKNAWHKATTSEKHDKPPKKTCKYLFSMSISMQNFLALWKNIVGIEFQFWHRTLDYCVSTDNVHLNNFEMICNI